MQAMAAVRHGEFMASAMAMVESLLRRKRQRGWVMWPYPYPVQKIVRNPKKNRNGLYLVAWPEPSPKAFKIKKKKRGWGCDPTQISVKMFYKRVHTWKKRVFDFCETEHIVTESNTQQLQWPSVNLSGYLSFTLISVTVPPNHHGRWFCNYLNSWNWCFDIILLLFEVWILLLLALCLFFLHCNFISAIFCLYISNAISSF